VKELVPSKQAELKELKPHHDVVLSNDTVGSVLGGMRGSVGLLWDCSLLDAEEGIRFRGHTIPDLQRVLPKAKKDGEPLPEALLWLLMTGEVPTEAQVKSVTQDLHARSALPKHVESLVTSLPKGMHPMTKLSSGVLALQTESEFVKAYNKNVHKSTLWEYALEDSLNLIARLPRVCALIYRNTFADGKTPPSDPNLDYSANFNRMLGYGPNGRRSGSGSEFDELMRLYLVIHADHEGGNVSAHTTRLVGSALSDPYLSLAAGLNGLAGPLHGLANQEVLRWTLDFQKAIKDSGKAVSEQAVIDQAWATLKAGNVIPGFGHAVLRKTDPRYMCQREFALKHLKDDELFKLVDIIFKVMPGVLQEHGKAKNPWPNVDAHSGCLLRYYGLNEENYYTVLFGLSRAMGVLSQLTWDRALGLPIERPKSVTTDWMKKFIAKQQKK